MVRLFGGQVDMEVRTLTVQYHLDGMEKNVPGSETASASCVHWPCPRGRLPPIASTASSSGMRSFDKLALVLGGGVWHSRAAVIIFWVCSSSPLILQSFFMCTMSPSSFTWMLFSLCRQCVDNVLANMGNMLMMSWAMQAAVSFGAFCFGVAVWSKRPVPVGKGVS